MGEIDFNLLGRELLRSVRGGLSQSALSRKLGYRGKQIHRLEAGERTVTWDIFAKACAVCGRDLRRSLRGRILAAEDPLDSAAVVTSIIGAVRLSMLAKDTGLSRFSLIRWREGRATPPLAVILQLIDYCQFNLFEFLGSLVDPDTLPSVKDAHQLRQRRKDIYYRFPETAAVIVCLQLDDYKTLPRHQIGFVAEKIGLSIEEERTILAELEDVGRIQLIDGRYVPTTDSVDLAGSDKVGIHRFMSFWLRRLLTFYDGAGDWTDSSSRFGMEVFAVNDELKAMVKEEFRTFQKRVRGMLHQQAQAKVATDQVIVLHSVFYDPLEISRARGVRKSL